MRLDLLFDSFYWSPPNPATEKNDISALLHSDAISIIQDSNLFWLTFCKEASLLEEKKNAVISFKESGNTLTVKACEKDYLSEMRSQIEKIRKIFLKNFIKKEDFTLACIGGMFRYSVRESSPVINEGEIERSDYISSRLFNDILQPSLPGLFQTFGARSVKCKIPQKIYSPYLKKVITEELEGFKVRWIQNANSAPPRQRSLAESIYAMVGQRFGDLELVARDGSIRVHRVVFFAQGGEVLQKKLQDSEIVLNFREFALATVEGFVRFVYLRELSLEYLQANNVDLIELLKIGEACQMPDLVNCCTSLAFESEDIGLIKSFADYKFRSY